MARKKSPYRRGQHPNSIAARFRDGEPSANPEGRPPKAALPKLNTLDEILQHLLVEEIQVTIGGREERMPRIQAMVGNTLNDFPRFSGPTKLRALREFGLSLARSPETHLHQPSQQTIEEIVARLADEAGDT